MFLLDLDVEKLKSAVETLMVSNEEKVGNAELMLEFLPLTAIVAHFIVI